MSRALEHSLTTLDRALLIVIAVCFAAYGYFTISNALSSKDQASALNKQTDVLIAQRNQLTLQHNQLELQGKFIRLVNELILVTTPTKNIPPQEKVIFDQLKALDAQLTPTTTPKG